MAKMREGYARRKVTSETEKRRDRVDEIAALNVDEFEALLGSVYAYNDTCLEYIDGSRGWDEVKRARAVVQLCASYLERSLI